MSSGLFKMIITLILLYIFFVALLFPRDVLTLDDIKDTAELLALRLDRGTGNLVMIGPRVAIKSSQILLDTQVGTAYMYAYSYLPILCVCMCAFGTQLDYIDQYIGIADSEKDMRDQLYSLKKQVGLYVCTSLI
jgi:hypothetical protein